tara:strand:+ start:25 stop:279 length:255 start_codon:yes stop_codon:yes gene_type:complete
LINPRINNPNRQKKKLKMKILLPYLKAVVEGAVPEGPTLRDSLHEMDRISKDPAISLDPKLRHYLQMRSYTKALDWLNGNGVEK